MFVRKEIFGDLKVNITDKPADTIQVAREIANAQTEERPHEPFLIVNLDARTCTLVANVIARKTVLASSGGNPSTRMHYFVNVAHDSFNFNEDYPAGRPLFDKQGELYNSTVWSGTCDSRIKVETDKMMRKLDVGDWIIYEDIGSYTAFSSTTFKDYTSPTPIYVISESLWNNLAMRDNNREN